MMQAINMGLVETAKQYVNDNKGLTITDFAEKIGVGRSLLSRYMNGKYDSDPTKIETALMQFFDGLGSDGDDMPEDTGEQLAISSPEEKCFTIPTLFKSHDCTMELAICEACRENSEMGIIVGKTGYGKTHVLKQYAKRHRVFYVACDESMTARDFIEAIEDAIGIPKISGSISKHITNLADFFNTDGNEGHLLIIDEADKLMTRHSFKKMEILRGLYDKLMRYDDSSEEDNSIERFKKKNRRTAGLVLAGEPALKEMLRIHLPRFRDRAGKLFYEMKGLNRGEILEYLSDLSFTSKAMDEMVRRGTQNNFRQLDAIIMELFREGSPRREITMGDIENATKFMMF